MTGKIEDMRKEHEEGEEEIVKQWGEPAHIKWIHGLGLMDVSVRRIQR